jgi:hypothetical protein
MTTTERGLELLAVDDAFLVCAVIGAAVVLSFSLRAAR